MADGGALARAHRECRRLEAENVQLRWALEAELTRLREVERLAGELATNVLKEYPYDAHTPPLEWLERIGFIVGQWQDKARTLQAKIDEVKPVQISDICPECKRPWQGPEHCTCGSLKGEF